MSSEIVIRAQGLGKVYRLYRRPEDRLKELVFRKKSFGKDFWALDNFYLEVRRGETIGIVGRNGSGKSTLLQLVCGTVQPTTGELEVRGRVAALLELGAGFNPEFTGRENVYLSAAVLGLSETEIEKRFPSIEAFAEIGAFIDQPVRQYSSGMYARLAFSVCAHVDADILVIDEILGVGDAGFQQRCMRFLNGFRKRGTILFVSHDASAVLSLCDRAIWLDQGNMRAGGSATEVCRRYHRFLSQAAYPNSAFQIGGRDFTPVPLPAAREEGSTQLKPFDFDLDSDWIRVDPPMIECAMLSTPNEERASMVEPGDEVRLCVDIRATRSLKQPVVAFAVRNRLGQVIFSDNTAQAKHGTPAQLEQGRRMKATFHFRMPPLAAGGYAIEAALFERTNQDPIDRLLDSLFVQVNSLPQLDGLADVAMRETRLVIGSGPLAREIGGRMPAGTMPVVEDDRWRSKNPMELSPFNGDAPWHGHGGAKIENAAFFHLDGSAATRIHGGEELELRVWASAQRPLSGPIVGFMLRNTLGQHVFGENTFTVSCATDRHSGEGETMTAYFRFQMPYLPTGEYLLAPSIIEGTQQSHIHLHWMEEALTLRVVESPVNRCVVGVPMLDVRLELDAAEAENYIA